MTTPRLAQILALADNGLSVQQIALAANVSPGYVYGILRDHRPARTRKARLRTSKTAPMIRGLHAQGHAPVRIAFLCRCSAAYVYRILGEVEDASR